MIYYISLPIVPPIIAPGTPNKNPPIIAFPNEDVFPILTPSSNISTSIKSSKL